MKPAASALFLQRRGSKPRDTVTANVRVPLDALKELLGPWNAELVHTSDFGHCFTIRIAKEEDDLQTQLRQLRAENGTVDQIAAIVKNWIGRRDGTATGKITHVTSAVNAALSAHGWYDLTDGDKV